MSGEGLEFSCLLVDFICCGSEIQSSDHQMLETTINEQRHSVFLTMIVIRELSHQYWRVINKKGLCHSVIVDFIRACVTIFLSFLTRGPNLVTFLDGDVNANVCSVFLHSPISTRRASLAHTPPPRCLVTNTHTHTHAQIAEHIHTQTNTMLNVSPPKNKS